MTGVARVSDRELDDSLGEAHLVAAKIKLFYDWDWPGAERELQRALNLIPNYPDVHGFYGTYLVVIGDMDRALAERRRMQELDPTSAFAATNVAWAYFYRHEYQQAIDQYRKALELDPAFFEAQIGLGDVFLYQGFNAEAVEVRLKAKTLNDAPPDLVEGFRQAYANGGIKAYWQKELARALELKRQGRGGVYSLARIYIELGDKDKAFAALDDAVTARHSLMVFLKKAPVYDPLRDDPRFSALLAKVGLK